MKDQLLNSNKDIYTETLDKTFTEVEFRLEIVITKRSAHVENL